MMKIDLRTKKKPHLTSASSARAELEAAAWKWNAVISLQCFCFDIHVLDIKPVEGAENPPAPIRESGLSEFPLKRGSEPTTSWMPENTVPSFSPSHAGNVNVLHPARHENRCSWLASKLSARLWLLVQRAAPSLFSFKNFLPAGFYVV